MRSDLTHTFTFLGRSPGYSGSSAMASAALFIAIGAAFAWSPDSLLRCVEGTNPTLAATGSGTVRIGSSQYRPAAAVPGAPRLRHVVEVFRGARRWQTRSHADRGVGATLTNRPMPASRSPSVVDESVEVARGMSQLRGAAALATGQGARVTLSPRTGHAMATAGSDGGVFAVGGATAAGDSAWRRDGAGWQPLAMGGPTNRSMIAAAYDSRRNVLVAFGGVGTRNGSRYGETWEWSGHAWQERDLRGPGARDHHAMAYDESRGYVVMYGGMNGDHKGLQSDTWTWDGATWTRAEETSAPGGIGHHAMAYDAKRQRVVMFGGITDDGPATSDVWEWDGRTWLRIAAPGPGIRSHMKMAYDAARGGVVIFGGGVPGAGPNGIPPTDTWRWDGATWARVATEGPMPRYLHAMAYDAKRQRVILTAGTRSARPYDTLSDTWEWDGAKWSEVK